MLILGLGSNIGNRAQNLNLAIDKINGVIFSDIKKSSVYETKALLPKDAPKSWDSNFLNMAITGRLIKDFSPQEMLELVKDIETKMGRKPEKRWSPRIIDIDILAWGDLIYNSSNLQIPHIALMTREFALKPLLELVPNWVHPKEL